MATDRARVERAQKALKEFRRMSSGLTSYARAVTGDRRLRIEPASATHTDGHTIFFRVPMRLADNVKHDRKLCDKRDPLTMQQLCEACSIREEILVSIYHEIAHIAYHSFAPFTDNDRKRALAHGVKLKGDRYSEVMVRKLKQYEQESPLHNTFMALAQSISEFLPGMVNILEDVRIDHKMYEARKGIRRMRESRMRRVVIEGIPKDDGTFALWKDAPLNSQMVAGMYALAAGFEIEGNYHEQVAEALSDPKLGELAKASRTARSASDVFNIAFDALVRGKELGFFEEETDPEPEEQESQPDPEDQKSDDKQDRAESGPDNEPTEDQESSDTDEGKPDDNQAEPSDDSSSQGDQQDASADGAGDLEEPSAEEMVPEDAEPTGKGESGEPSDDGSEDSGGGAPSEGDEGDGEASQDPSEFREDEGDQGSESGHQNSDSSPDDADREGEVSSDSGESSSEGSVGSNGEPSDDADSQGDAAEPSSNDNPSGDMGTESVQSGDSHDGGADPSGASDPSAGSNEEAGEVDDSPESGSGGDDPQDIDDTESGDGDQADDPQAGDGESESGSGDSSSGEAGTPEPSDLAGPEEPAQEHPDGDDAAPEPQDPDPADDSGDTEPVDSGEYDEDKVYQDDTPAMGGAGDIPEYVEAITGHHGDHEVESAAGDNAAEVAADSAALHIAIEQGAYFEKAPQNVTGVNIRRYDKPDMHYEDAWRGTNGGYAQQYMESDYKKIGLRGDFAVPESVLGPALLVTRRAFEDNARAKHMHNLKSGKIRSGSLAKRAPMADPRMFKKTVLPGKKSYSVLIGIDISGSTVGKNIMLAKRAARAQAELCQRAGVDFAVYAHTADGDDERDLTLEMYEIKAFGEQWTNKTREALDNIGSFAYNLDGHSIEYYRKLIERQPTTDKIILYYTDGKMPAANYHEELDVLQDQIRHCKRQGIALMGVGIRTDSPTKHGLDTVRVDTDADLTKVIMHLEKKLVNR